MRNRVLGFILWPFQRLWLGIKWLLRLASAVVGLAWTVFFPFAMAALVYFFVEEVYLIAIGAEKANKLTAAALFGAAVAGATFTKNKEKEEKGKDKTGE